MAIMSRIIRLWKADLHGVMDQLEDKSLLLKQYLREMETGLQQKERQLAQMVQNAPRIDQHIQQCTAELAKLEQDLDLALRKEKDDIARLLIRKRRTQQTILTQLQQQAQLLTEEKCQLQETLIQQRLQYEQIKVKAVAFSRQAEQDRCDDMTRILGEPSGMDLPSDEEIELELMQRKEALKGGAA